MQQTNKGVRRPSVKHFILGSDFMLFSILYQLTTVTLQAVAPLCHLVDKYIEHLLMFIIYH